MGRTVRLLMTIATAFVLTVSMYAAVQAKTAKNMTTRNLSIKVGQSVELTFHNKISSVRIRDPKIADVSVKDGDPKRITVIGIHKGGTFIDVFFRGKGNRNRKIRFDVEVR